MHDPKMQWPPVTKVVFAFYHALLISKFLFMSIYVKLINGSFKLREKEM